MALAAALELFGRYLYKVHGVGYGVTGTLTLLATVVWGASAVHVIRRAHGARNATRALFVGACLIVLSQATSMGEHFQLPGVAFLMRTAQPVPPAIEEGSFIVGLALVFLAFYLSVLEADAANSGLQREREALAGEVAERCRAEEALRQAYDKTEQRVEERTASLRDLNQRLLDEIAQRTEYERALQASEARYRDLIEQASDVVWRIDAQGRFTFVSPVAERLVGYKPEELLGKFFQITLDEQSARESQAFLRQRMAGEFGTRSIRLEVVYRRKDGSLFPGEVSTSTIFDPAGNLIEIQAITRDITERKRAQEALHRRAAIEELVAATSSRFLNVSSDEIEAEIVRTLETAGRFLGVDRTFVRLFSADGATFGRDYEWFAEGLQPRSLSALRLHLGSFEWTTGKLMRGENLVVARIADLPPEASAERILWEAMGIASIVLISLVIGNSVGGVLGLTSERTEHAPTEEDNRLMRLVAGILSNALLRERTEQALRASEERYRGLIEGLSEAVYRMTLPDGRYEYMGSAARDVFGYSAEQFMSKPRYIYDIIHPDSAAYVEDMWNRLIRGEMPSTYEYRIIDSEGNERWILQSNTLIRNEAGVAVAIEGICRNVTAEKQAHQLIEEQRARFLDSAKMSVLGEMASNVAHEINNPLAIVSGSAEQLHNLLRRDPIPAEHVPRLTDAIVRNVSRIQTIVKGLRTFARKGEDDPFQETPLKAIVNYTVVLCQDRFLSYRVALAVEEIPEDMTIECRPTQVMEVLFNLLSNALHAVEAGNEKWVAIAARDEGSGIALSVTDSGCGVPPEVAKTMFDRFVTSKEFGKGIGLGLSISKRIALTHNGSLTLDTTCPNTRFVVRLPKRQPTLADGIKSSTEGGDIERPAGL